MTGKEYIENQVQNKKKALTENEEAIYQSGLLMLSQVLNKDCFVKANKEKALTDDEMSERVRQIKSSYQVSDRIELEHFYLDMPFFMKHDTQIGKKENYLFILAQFERAYNQKKNEEEDILFCMAILDCMDVMSQEIFELYKKLEQYFKRTLQKLNLYEEKQNLSLIKASRLSYLLLKGCRLKALLTEKYQEQGKALFRQALELGKTEELLNGELLMALSQLLLLKKWEGEDINAVYDYI